MRSRLLNNSFIGYLKAIYKGVPQHKYRYLEFILIVVACFILGNAVSSMDTYYFSGESYTATEMEMGWLILLVCLIFGTVRRIKPSVMCLAPISYKRRVAYNYASLLILFILSLVFIVVASVVFVCFMMLLGLLFGGNIDFSADFEYASINVPASGIWFSVFILILIFGVSVIISYIPNKKLRYVAIIAFPVFMKALSLMLVNFVSGEDYLVHKACVTAQFETLPLYGVWLAVTGVISICMLVCSVLVMYYNEKPSDL